MGGKRVAVIRGKKKSSSRNTRKKEKLPTGRRFLGAVGKTESRRVGARKQLHYTAQTFGANIKPKDLDSPENRAILLDRFKKFRKKFKTKKTRMTVVMRMKRGGVWIDQAVSISKHEEGNVEERLDRTLEHIRNSIKGYAKFSGFKLGKISQIKIESVRPTKKKKGRRTTGA